MLSGSKCVDTVYCLDRSQCCFQIANMSSQITSPKQAIVVNTQQEDINLLHSEHCLLTIQSKNIINTGNRKTD